MSGDLAAAALAESVLGLALILIGYWGLGAAEALAARRGDEESRARAEASYRRGSIGCQVLGGVLLVFAVIALLGGGQLPA